MPPDSHLSPDFSFGFYFFFFPGGKRKRNLCSAIFCKLGTPSCGFIHAWTFLGELKRCWRFPAHTAVGLQNSSWIPSAEPPAPFPVCTPVAVAMSCPGARLTLPMAPGLSPRGALGEPLRSWLVHGVRASPEGKPGDVRVEEGCPRRSWDSAGTVPVLCWDSLRLCWEGLVQRWDSP